MPIRALDFVLQDKKIIKEAPLSALRDTRLGIDANVYVRRLLTQPETKEPFVPALGGVPLALEEHITSDMRVLQNLSIKPIFVFNGLQPPRRERPLSTEDNRPARRQAGWEHYEKSRNDAAMQAFGMVPMNVADVFRVVHRCFLHRKTEFVVAPYLAWAQLLYLERHPKAYIHSTWSSTEFLMFEGVDRLILNVDFKKQSFTFLSKRDLLQELAVSTEQFLDVGILAGFEQAGSIPIPDWSWKAVIDLVKQYRTAAAAINAISQENPGFVQTGYIETYARARSMIKYSLVLASDQGSVLPLPLALLPPPPGPVPGTTPEQQSQVLQAYSQTVQSIKSDVPSDIHEVFSYRLPDEVYFQMFRGLISPQILGALTSGHWVEQAPLCGGETDEYRRFLKDIITEHPNSPRCTALALLTSCLNQFWQKRAVTAIYYFSPQVDGIIPHNSEQTTKALSRLYLWNVPSPVIEEELRRQHSSTIDIRLCLGATAEGANWAARTRVAKDKDRLLDKKDEVVANTLWRFLELRGFLSAQHTPTPHGKALYQALTKSRVNDKFQEPLYLAIELVRAGVLHSAKFGNRTWSGGPNLGGESDKTNAMLVMRVLSIVPLTFKAEPWSGPVSRSLLVFNSFLRTLSRSLRALLESTTVNLLLNNDARRNREDYLEIALSLPFKSDTNTGMGVVWKGWCDACSHIGSSMGLGTPQELGGFAIASKREGGESLSEQEERTRKESLEGVKKAVSDMLEGAFGNVRDVRNELARGVRFWDTVMHAINTLHSEPNGLHAGLYEQFEAANKWLEPFRP